MITNSMKKSFTNKKILKIDFQNFYVSWKAAKSISRTFIGSLRNETIAKFVIHRIDYKEIFHSVSSPKRNCKRSKPVKNYLNLQQRRIQNPIKHPQESVPQI